MCKRNHHDQIPTCKTESHVRIMRKINIHLAQESPIINDSNTRSLNYYLFVCTSPRNILLHTLLISYLFYILSTGYYFNYKCTNSQLLIFNSLLPTSTNNCPYCNQELNDDLNLNVLFKI